MKKDRHPHPHKDPRQPRQGAIPCTNPPVFAFKPPTGVKRFRIQVARDEGFSDLAYDWDHLAEPLYLPEKALEPGTYFWRWEADGSEEGVETFCFEITSEAVQLEIPSAHDWLEQSPQGHPRLYFHPEQLEELQNSRQGERAKLWAQLEGAADVILEESHEIEEPPYLADRKRDYQEFFRVWYRVLHESRQFINRAQTLGLAYAASGKKTYAEAACRRLASISKWDPMGSSHISHNDEAHMSVIWNGPLACDLVWDRFTDEQREVVIDQFKRRGQITFEHMHDRLPYGVARFDSHAGREIVFLAQIALVFHEDIPEAREWLEWLRPVLCGIWPIWAGDDGAWAEGLAYGQAYVGIMTMFATSLKVGTGIDLYRKPFWKGHAEWRRWCWPPYAEWIGFGDHSERWAGSWYGNADLVETIALQSGTSEFDDYIAALRREAEHSSSPEERKQPGVDPQRFVAGLHNSTKVASSENPGSQEPPGVLKVFSDAGWAAFRTNLNAAEKDVALLFRSSPYGSISHSHDNHNDFILHAGGKLLAMPSGYYDGYGSAHHAHWVWPTKSHNCLTLSDAPQIMRSHEARGSIDNAYENDALAYLCGNADAAYADRATRCRRHVVFLKSPQCFLMIDEFKAQGKTASALQWNLHSWSPFEIDEGKKSFHLQREGAALQGRFLYHHNSFFSLTEGFDPPPEGAKANDQWKATHHLKFTCQGYVTQANLGVILSPSHSKLNPAAVETERIEDTELARLGDDVVLLNQGKGIHFEGLHSDALAVLRLAGSNYQICEAGLSVMSG